MANEGLTLETLAVETLYNGQFTLSTQCITPNYLVTPPLTQHHSVLENLPPVLLMKQFLLIFVYLCIDKIYSLKSERF